MMRTATIALVAMMSLAAAPAHSQGSMSGHGHHAPEQNNEEKKNMSDDKAYKSALDRIPVPKEKFDPWQNMREKPQSK